MEKTESKERKSKEIAKVPDRSARFAQKGLVAGPRKVNLVLTIIAIRPSFLSMIAASFLVIPQEYTLYLLPLLFLFLWFSFRRFQLLRNGFLVRPEIVSTKARRWRLETNSMRDGKQ